jgi:thiosulfate/3-mercaptopyruvate sulfurtransferase
VKACREETSLMKKVFVLLITATFLTTITGSAFAQWVNPDLLMTPEILKKNLPDPSWVVIDCRKKKSYQEGHIPGSISLGKACGKALRDQQSIVLDVNKLEAIFGKAGINNESTVVVYSDLKDIKGAVNAAVTFWILEYIGHKKVHFLNGGIEAWKADGNKLVKNETKLSPKKYKTQIIERRIATTEEMFQIAKGIKEEIQVIDARPKFEHNGKKKLAIKGGHIPRTTINIHHKMMFNIKSGKLKSPPAMKEIFKSLDKNKRTIAYCQIGSRSALTYLVLRLMGFKDPANYDESWIVWGNNLKYPAVSEY